MSESIAVNIWNFQIQTTNTRKIERKRPVMHTYLQRYSKSARLDMSFPALPAMRLLKSAPVRWKISNARVIAGACHIFDDDTWFFTMVRKRPGTRHTERKEKEV
jgi:hypothetical protein